MILNRILIIAMAVSFPSIAMAGSLLILEEGGEGRSIVTIGAAAGETASIRAAGTGAAQSRRAEGSSLVALGEGRPAPVSAQLEERSAGQPMPAPMMIRGGLVSLADGPVAASRSGTGDTAGESFAATPADMMDGAPPPERAGRSTGSDLRPM